MKLGVGEGDIFWTYWVLTYVVVNLYESCVKD